jgi:hypothetical protein
MLERHGPRANPGFAGKIFVAVGDRVRGAQGIDLDRTLCFAVARESMGCQGSGWIRSGFEMAKKDFRPDVVVSVGLTLQWHAREEATACHPPLRSSGVGRVPKPGARWGKWDQNN